MATIHVYRQKHVVAKGLKPSIYVDGKEFGRLHNGRFLIAEITPGKHIIMAGRSEGGHLVDFESGKHYYFRLGHKNWAGTALSGRQPMMLELVTADEAEREMSDLKPN